MSVSYPLFRSDNAPRLRGIRLLSSTRQNVCQLITPAGFTLATLPPYSLNPARYALKGAGVLNMSMNKVDC